MMLVNTRQFFRMTPVTRRVRNAYCTTRRLVVLLHQYLPSGLRFNPSFVPPEQEKNIKKSCWELLNKIRQYKTDESSKGYLSQQHNLPTKQRYFHNIVVHDSQRKLHAQHFLYYGHHLHTLTYFIGNRNLPHLVLPIVRRLSKLPEVREVGCPKYFDWRFTFNCYFPGEDIPLFPFHQDIAPNGEVTAIYSVGEGGEFQVSQSSSDKDIVCSIPLSSNSIAVLSGQTRWNLWHRVIHNPDRIEKPIEGQPFRYSLVFGVQEKRRYGPRRKDF